MHFLSYILFAEYIIKEYIVKFDYNTKAFEIFKSNSSNVIWGDSQTREGINNLNGFINLSYDADTYRN